MLYKTYIKIPFLKIFFDQIFIIKKYLQENSLTDEYSVPYKYKHANTLGDALWKLIQNLD